jgi:hypothetical protein
LSGSPCPRWLVGLNGGAMGLVAPSHMATWTCGPVTLAVIDVAQRLVPKGFAQVAGVTGPRGHGIKYQVERAVTWEV